MIGELNNDTNNTQTQIEKVIEKYDRIEAELKLRIDTLNDELNRVSTASYSSGVPDVSYNRGDEGSDFSFPIRWGITCKHMEKSGYLEPLLTFFKGLFNTFNYYIEKPQEYESDTRVKLAYDFMTNQFEKAGGIKDLIVNISYNTLVYGFAFFTPKLEKISGKKYGINGTLDGLRDFKYYDPTLLNKFIFSEEDADELQGVDIYTAPKMLGQKDDSGELYIDYLNSLLEQKEERLIHIDFDMSIGGHCSYGNIFGDPLGRPFLYSVYSVWKILESMDNSFYRNLSNIGEHSFNFRAYDTANGLQGDRRNQVYQEVRQFVNQKGGVFISEWGTLEKIECIDANEWWSFRDSMLSNLYKAKNVDIKSLGLNKGATRNLADISQTDSIIMAKELIEHFIKQINRTFMRRYFNLNFKNLILNEVCDYFKIGFEITQNNISTQNNTQQVSMSAINKSDKVNSINVSLEDVNGDVVSQSIQYANGNPISTQTAIPLSRFIKQVPDTISQFIINTSDLDKVLVQSSDELKKYIMEFIKNAISDDNLIEKALTKPSSFIRGALLNKNQRSELINNIKNLLENNAYSFFDYKAKEILKGAGGLNFEDLFGKSINEWIEEQIKYFLKNKINITTEDFTARVEKLAFDKLFDLTRGYTNDTDISQAKDLILNSINNLKGKDIESLTDKETINIFQDCSNIANDNAAKKIKGLMKVRTGVLESMCSHCQKYFGVVYKQNDNGDWYNIDHDYKELPDTDCIGSKYGNKCRCYYVPVADNVLQVIQNFIQRG